MPDIYTREWYDSLQDMLNRNPDVAKNAPRGEYTLLAELRGDGSSPYIPDGETLAFSVCLDDGKCTRYEELGGSTPPRKEFDFVFEFPASVFEGVGASTVDPIEAGLKGVIKITGDMRILIRHADLVNVLHDVYAREVDTSWPRGKPPYGG